MASFMHPQFANGVYKALQTAFSSHPILPIWERTVLDAYLLTHSYILMYISVCLILSILGILLCLLKNDIIIKAKFFSLSTAFLLLFFCFWSNQLTPLLAIAMLIIAFPIGSHYISKVASEKQFILSYSPPVLALYSLTPIFIAAHFWSPINNFGYGLRENETNLVDFINRTKVAGPYFHNSSISGLLAYGLEDENNLFIATQPLAHPVDFYTTQYFPNILDPYAWKAIHDKYLFNSIIFRLEGESIKNLEFMGNLLGNGRWAMIYFKKDYEVILVRRNEKNQALINQFEIIPNAQ